MGRGAAHTGLWWGNHRKDHCEHLGGSSSSEIRGMDWIDLVHSSARWRDLVNAVMNFRVGQSAGNFLTDNNSANRIGSDDHQSVALFMPRKKGMCKAKRRTAKPSLEEQLKN